MKAFMILGRAPERTHVPRGANTIFRLDPCTAVSKYGFNLLTADNLFSLVLFVESAAADSCLVDREAGAHLGAGEKPPQSDALLLLHQLHLDLLHNPWEVLIVSLFSL